MDNLSFSDFIQKIQQELVTSQQQREEAGIAPLFRVDSLEIEASVIVVENKTANTGFDLRIVSANAELATEKHTTHTIRLRLTVGDDKSVSRTPFGAYPRRVRDESE